MKLVVECSLVCALALLVGMSATAYAQPITITTFAGPQELPGVADGVGSEARLRHPDGVAVDRAGNVYIADEYNHEIRKVTPSGAVTTLAGLFYTQGQSDGSGSQARFVFPQGVATDAAGNVYVADTHNRTIRKITPEGIVSTIAGSGGVGSADGQGTAASFSYPAGLAVHGDGTIYVADTLNHTIRKVTPSGNVTTLAGLARSAGAANGVGETARFYNPKGVAVDEAGNVYVVDTWNHAIRKVTPTGTVSTFCGAAGLQGNATGPCASARFNYPNGIAIDRHGDLFVTDTFNGSIRKITQAGMVTTVAGSSNEQISRDGPLTSARFEHPQGIAVDSSGAIYVTELSDATLRKIADGQVTTLAGMAVGGARAHVDGVGVNARFLFPTGIAADSIGNLYVADTGDQTVRKISPSAEVTTLAGRPGVEGSANGAGTAATFAAPRGITVDRSGNVYVADSENNTIRKISSGGSVSTFAGTPSSFSGSADGQGAAAKFSLPWGLASDLSGNVFVADSRNHTIRKITPSGMVSTLAGTAGAGGSADGTGAAARFNEPHGVATDEAGNVYVADSENHTIRKITPQGAVITVAGLPKTKGTADGMGSAARFYYPSALAVAADGTIYVADSFNYMIRKIDSSGSVTTVAGSPSTGTFFGFLQGDGTADGTGSEAQLDSPGGLTIDPSGNLFIADSSNAAIRMGRPTIPDVPTGRITPGASEILQLDTSHQTATAWEWRIMRRPAGSRANLSSTTVRNPTFRPDVPGLFVFRLTASGPAGARITYASFESTTTIPPADRRRAVRH